MLLALEARLQCTLGPEPSNHADGKASQGGYEVSKLAVLSRTVHPSIYCLIWKT